MILAEKARTSKSEFPEPPTVSIFQWCLVLLSLVCSLFGYLTSSYDKLSLLATILLLTNLTLSLLIAKEALRTRLLGKLFLIFSCLIFYWVDAFEMARQQLPFAVPQGLPVNGLQFDPGLLHDGFFYVALFQLMLFVGYRIRFRLGRVSRWICGRLDPTQSYHRSIKYVFAACALIPFLMTYDFDLRIALDALLASRSENIEAQDIGLFQVLFYFGMFGVSAFLVDSLMSRSLTRLRALAVAVLALLPYVAGGTRHFWLFISLPLTVIYLQRFSGRWNTTRLATAAAIMIVLLGVLQLQYTLRSVGWSKIGTVAMDDVAQVDVTGQFRPLLFAEYLVPDFHEHFMEPAEYHFIIQWMPRRLWPDKPVMKSWDFYNSAYTQGAAFNVTPSVIGQYYMDWGVPGIIWIGIWLGFLASLADTWTAIIDVNRQRAMVVVLGMFYAFIISSFRFYSPIYFAYLLFAFISMWFLTTGIRKQALQVSRGLQPVQLARRSF